MFSVHLTSNHHLGYWKSVYIISCIIYFHSKLIKFIGKQEVPTHVVNDLSIQFLPNMGFDINRCKFCICTLLTITILYRKLNKWMNGDKTFAYLTLFPVYTPHLLFLVHAQASFPSTCRTLTPCTCPTLFP